MSNTKDEHVAVNHDDKKSKSTPSVEDDPRFNPPTPSPWKRAALLLLIAALFWLAYDLRAKARAPAPKIIHANRYSKEHKFRPAASPILTEKLKDGKTRIRGAHPTSR